MAFFGVDAKEEEAGMLWVLGGLLAAIAVYLLLIAPGRNARARAGAIPRVPYAHRGLHGRGVPENSLSAFRLAAQKGYGMELDVHLTRDGHLAVMHDADLKRMCGVAGRIPDMTGKELKACRLLDTGEQVPLLPEVLDAVRAYHSPLIIEMKSDGDSWRRLPETLLDCMKSYPGFWCAESFDPRMLWRLKKLSPDTVRGQLAYDPRKIGEKRREIRYALGACLLMDFWSRPDFIAYRYDTDGNFSFRVVRKLFRPGLIAWTVQNERDFERLRSKYDVQIFEGFEPSYTPFESKQRKGEKT